MRWNVCNKQNAIDFHRKGVQINNSFYLQNILEVLLPSDWD